jgi:hypothetical protein
MQSSRMLPALLYPHLTLTIAVYMQLYPITPLKSSSKSIIILKLDKRDFTFV